MGSICHRSNCPENGVIVARAIIAGPFIVGAIIAGGIVAGAIVGGVLIAGTIVFGVNFAGVIVAGENFAGAFFRGIIIAEQLSLQWREPFFPRVLNTVQKGFQVALFF